MDESNETTHQDQDLDLRNQFPEDQQETEDDLQQISFRDAVVTNADWTIESIHLQIAKGTIDLQPSFQRRNAWDLTRKSRLIESIIVGMPVPNIALAENKEHRGRFIVIDGKQRLMAIDEFMRGVLVLRDLDLRDDLNGATFAELTVADREAFENSTLRATLIKNWRDENFLYAAFYRLNVGSLPLSPQELRKALIGGQLIDAIEEYLVGSASFQRVFGTALDRRMRDSELVLRFLAFDRSFASYSGDFKRFLDETTRYFEADWNGRRPDFDAALARLDRALSTSHDIFGSNAFHKALGGRFERVMNRAIFDCVARYFADDLVARTALSNRPSVLQAFEEVCADVDFRAAIEKTTKSPGATHTRLVIWGRKLAGVLGMTFDEAAFRIL